MNGTASPHCGGLGCSLLAFASRSPRATRCRRPRCTICKLSRMHRRVKLSEWYTGDAARLGRQKDRVALTAQFLAWPES